MTRWPNQIINLYRAPSSSCFLQTTTGYPSLSFLFLSEPSCQNRLFSNHSGRKKFLTVFLFQFSTRGWPRTLDVTKPQDKRVASPPTNFKDKHEVDFFSFQTKRIHHLTKKQLLMTITMMMMIMLLIICF